MGRQATVVAVCRGTARPLGVGPDAEVSAIDKRPVDGLVAVGVHGLAGDEQADRVHHGGPDQALYAYAQEDADHWAAALQRAVPPGVFGENLRTAGVDVSGALIGERWRVGGVLVAVTAPRVPCRTFAAFWDVPDLVGRFVSAGRPGAYLRVVEPGAVRPGDRVEVVDRPAHDVSVADVLRIHTRDRHEVVRLAHLEGMASRLQAWVEQRLAG